MSDALLQQAWSHHKAGNLAEAARGYSAILATDPRNFEALLRLGVVHFSNGRFEDAERLLASAAEVDPQSADAFFFRGCALQNLRRYRDALACFTQTLALKPDHIEAQNNRGTTLLAMGRATEALASFDVIAALHPEMAAVHDNRAAALVGLKRYGEALEAADRALAINPRDIDALNNRAAAQMGQGQLEDALRTYRRLLEYQPTNVPAMMHAGAIFQERHQYAEAFAAYDRGFTIDPNVPYLEGWRLHLKLHLCNWLNITAERQRLNARVTEGKLAAAPFVLLAASSSSETQLKCAQSLVADRFPPVPAVWTGERYTHDKIRIGYLSGEFREQATAHLTAGLFEAHDRSAFDVHAYSAGTTDNSPMRRRLEAAFDTFTDIVQLTGGDVARAVRMAEIDVLVNLNGYFGTDRTDVFAFRPAPLQVSWLGFPATMGAPFMDYIIADKIVIPEDQQRNYTEKVVYLPGSYQANDGKRAVSNKVFTRAECGLPQSGFVFCCFNSSFKLNPETFAVWMSLLGKVPGSVLWLLEGGGNERNLRTEAQRHGIEPQRIVFAPRLPLAEHLARHRLADLFLDTIPCNAHTTASDALWAGLPVLTILGTTFAGRVAASLLNAVGMPELVTRSFEEYETLARKLAQEPNELAALKTKLARNRQSTSLFDTAGFARKLERAYAKMVERQRRGETPESFTAGDDA